MTARDHDYAITRYEDSAVLCMGGTTTGYKRLRDDPEPVGRDVGSAS